MKTFSIPANLVTRTDAARRLGIDVRRLNRIIDAGRLNPVRVPGFVREFIHLSELDRMAVELSGTCVGAA